MSDLVLPIVRQLRTRHACHTATLEVITRGAVARGRHPPVLLVHGAWHAAWCWEGFQDPLARRGIESHALSLRGHGGSGGRLLGAGIEEYVDDVVGVLDAMADTPVVVGHSMGGFVVRRLMERRRVAGAAFLASVPPGGVLPMHLRLARRDPLGFAACGLTFSGRPVVRDHRRVRDMFFSPKTASDNVAHAAARIGDESYLAGLCMLAPRAPRPVGADTQVMVLDATLDNCFDRADADAVVQSLPSAARRSFAIGHDMILDNGWEDVCDALAEFIETRTRRCPDIAPNTLSNAAHLPGACLGLRPSSSA